MKFELVLLYVSLQISFKTIKDQKHLFFDFSSNKVTVVSDLGEEVTYDYVFGGPRSAVSYSTLKLTSPPVRLRPDGKFCK